jgi:hypothetical protein
MLSELKKIFNRTKVNLSNQAVVRLTSNKFLTALMVIRLQEKSRKYLAGGLLGYFYCSSRDLQINLKNSIILGRNAAHVNGSHHIERAFSNLETQVPLYVRNRLSNIREFYSKQTTFVSLLPAGWPRVDDEIGFPHAWHIAKSAEKAKVKYIDIATKYISGNPEISQQFDIDLEWSEIRATLENVAIDVLLISGNKRSYSEKVLAGLLELRVEHPNMKVCLLMLDDWNLDYCDLVEKWDPYVDYVIAYEFDSVVSKRANLKNAKVIVWPFPRNPALSKIKTSIEPLEYNFFASLYLNRLPWIYLIIRFIRRTVNKREFKALTSISAGKYRLTIRDYLEKFVGTNKAFFHFLERTPDAFTLTASVWDSFANGSLTIVQTDAINDPLDKFFVPGVHYLRFSCAHELKEIIQFLDDDESHARRIALAGQAYFTENYSPTVLFEDLSRAVNCP